MRELKGQAGQLVRPVPLDHRELLVDQDYLGQTGSLDPLVKLDHLEHVVSLEHLELVEVLALMVSQVQPDNQDPMETSVYPGQRVLEGTWVRLGPMVHRVPTDRRDNQVVRVRPDK